jgi:hypothetical protein
VHAPLIAALLVVALSTRDALIRVGNPGLPGFATDVPPDLKTSRALAFAPDLSPVGLVAPSTQFERLDTSKGKFFAGVGLRLGL